MAGGHRRKFTEHEKRAILGEAGERGVNIVLREQNLSYSVFAKWKAKFQAVKDQQPSKTKILQQLRQLTIENERLRKIIANMALELQVKSEKQMK